MKAPDKIYIQAQDGKTITLVRLYDTDIEYICKDALLEWAKGLQEKYKEVYSDLELVITLNKLIEKLNSL